MFQAFSYVFYVLLGIPFGYLADKYSKKYILIAGYAVNLIRIALWIFFKGFWIIFIGEILMVIVRLYTTGMPDSYVAEYLYEKKAPTQIMLYCSKCFSSISYGTSAAVLISPLLYSYFGFFALLYAEFCLTLIGSIILFFLPQTKTRHQPALSATNLASIVKTFYHNTYLAYLVTFVIIGYIALTLFVASFQSLLKLSAAPTIFFGLVYFLNMLIRGFFCSNLIYYFQKIKIQNFFRCTFVLVISGLFLLSLAFKLLNVYFSIGILIFICIVIGFQAINQVFAVGEIHKQAKPELRATMMAFYNILIRGCGGLMLLAFQQLATYMGFSISSLFFAAFSCIAGLFVLRKLINATQTKT